MCACKCAVSQTLGSLHIYMHTSDTRVTAHLHAHIRHSAHCTFTCTQHAHIRHTQLTAHLHAHIRHTQLTAHLHAHIRHSAHCTVFYLEFSIPIEDFGTIFLYFSRIIHNPLCQNTFQPYCPISLHIPPLPPH